MKRLKKVVSLIALLVLVGTDFLNPISYALEQQEENFEVVENNSLEEISGEEGSVNEINDEVENIGDNDILGESDEDEEDKEVEVNDKEESGENEYADETDDGIDNDF